MMAVRESQAQKDEEAREPRLDPDWDARWFWPFWGVSHRQKISSFWSTPDVQIILADSWVSKDSEVREKLGFLMIPPANSTNVL